MKVGGNVLKPIPGKILQSTATVQVCTGVDRYQNQTYATYTVNRVHLQPTNEIRKSYNNTEMNLRSILFVDARISKPHLDWAVLFQSAQEAKGDVKVTVRGITYTVMSVDELRDDEDRLHHLEIGLG